MSEARAHWDFSQYLVESDIVCEVKVCIKIRTRKCVPLTLNNDGYVYGIVSTGLFSVMVIDEIFGKRALVSLPRLTNDNVLGELHMLENYLSYIRYLTIDEIQVFHANEHPWIVICCLVT